jgi:hypothetical protein
VARALVPHWFKAVSLLRLRCKGSATATSMVAKVGWPVFIKIELDGVRVDAKSVSIAKKSP